MSYYFLHVWSVLDFDYRYTEFLNRNVHPPLIGSVALEIDQLPADPLFQIWPLFFCTSEIKLVMFDIEPDTLEFAEVTRISKGQNLNALYPNIDLPRSYWKIKFKGRPAIDHFGLWKDLYLVVSEQALSVLRQSGVFKAEDDRIDMDVSSYFSSPRKDFWINRGLTQ